MQWVLGILSSKKWRKDGEYQAGDKWDQSGGYRDGEEGQILGRREFKKNNEQHCKWNKNLRARRNDYPQKIMLWYCWFVSKILKRKQRKCLKSLREDERSHIGYLCCEC